MRKKVNPQTVVGIMAGPEHQRTPQAIQAGIVEQDMQVRDIQVQDIQVIRRVGLVQIEVIAGGQVQEQHIPVIPQGGLEQTEVITVGQALVLDTIVESADIIQDMEVGMQTADGLETMDGGKF